MSSTPEDVFFEILLRLPVKFTFVCKCVCKTWYSLISSHNFVRKHLDVSTQKNYFNLLVKGRKNISSPICQRYQLYSVSYDSLLSSTSSTDELDIVELDFLKFYKNHLTQLIGTCDGLVCIWTEFECFYLWNPATKEYKLIPKSPTKHGGSIKSELFAFGYDCKLDDYKLVMVMHEHDNEEEHHLVKVYTLGSNSWRNTQTISCRPHLEEDRGVLVKGSFHWLCKTKSEEFSTILISLDLSEERFQQMQLPKESSKNNHRCVTVGVLEGCLCVLFNVLEIFQVWVMEDYGFPESWTKRFTIAFESIAHVDDDITDLRLIWSFKNGEILFKSFYRGLVFFYPEHGSARNPVIRRLSFFDEDVYVESLVSLKSGKYVGRKTRRGINRNIKKNYNVLRKDTKM